MSLPELCPGQSAMLLMHARVRDQCAAQTKDHRHWQPVLGHEEEVAVQLVLVHPEACKEPDGLSVVACRREAVMLTATTPPTWWGRDESFSRLTQCQHRQPHASQRSPPTHAAILHSVHGLAAAVRTDTGLPRIPTATGVSSLASVQSQPLLAACARSSWLTCTSRPEWRMPCQRPCTDILQHGCLHNREVLMLNICQFCD